MRAVLAGLLLPLFACAASIPRAAEEDEPPTPCERGYCHYDEDGNLVLWGNLTRDDLLVMGFTSVEKEQEEYNRWAENNRRAGDIPGLVFVNDSPGGWHPHKELLRAPRFIPVTGRYGLRTLKISNFMDGAHILQLWERLRKHCADLAVEEEKPVCQLSVFRYAGEDFPRPRLTERAAVLRRAFEVSRQFDSKVDTLEPKTSLRDKRLPKRRRTDYLAPRDIPEGFFGFLAEMAGRIDALIAKAKHLERKDKTIYVHPLYR